LVLGGTSSLAKRVIPICISQGFRVVSTHRSQKPKSRFNQQSFLYLDVSSMKSIEKFLESIEKEKFTHVLCLIGSTSNLHKSSSKSFKQIKKYIDTYITNLVYLLDNLYSNDRVSKNSSILVISSRAARFGSKDHYYSVVKSSLEGFIKSKGKSVDNGIKLNGASFGLIKGSQMQKDMSRESVLSHKLRSSNKLLDATRVSELIFKTLRNKKIKSGRIIYLGPQYE
jgi:NADP-dependent 3-hydroxy acid dehydrogenase YdfG